MVCGLKKRLELWLYLSLPSKMVLNKRMMIGTLMNLSAFGHKLGLIAK